MMLQMRVPGHLRRIPVVKDNDDFPLVDYLHK
jgi:hypothetical protein